MLSQHLIECALSLTGKTMYDMDEMYMPGNHVYKYTFSIEKFSYYLLSPEFLGTYVGKISPQYHGRMYSKFFSEAIYDYQSGNEEPLTTLLSKI